MFVFAIKRLFREIQNIETTVKHLKCSNTPL